MSEEPDIVACGEEKMCVRLLKAKFFEALLLLAVTGTCYAQPCNTAVLYTPNPATFPFDSPLGGAQYQTVTTVTEADGTVEPPVTTMEPIPTGSILWNNPELYAEGAFGGTQGAALFQSCSGVFPSAGPASIDGVTTNGQFSTVVTVSSSAGIMSITEKGTLIVEDFNGSCPYTCLSDVGGYTKTYSYIIQTGAYTISVTAFEDGAYVDPTGMMTQFSTTLSASASGTWPVILTGCDLGLPDSLQTFPTGPLSRSRKPSTITASFTPTMNGVPTSLTAAAAACGFEEFDWQQTIDNWPPPSNPSQCQLIIGPPLCLAANSAPFTFLTAPPSFYDPPPGGYTYFNFEDFSLFNPFLQANPFYYDPTLLSSACAVTTKKGACSVPIISSTTVDDDTLNFFDSPNDPLLPAGAHLAFTTRLVGVLSGNVVGPVLSQWSWISTYSGTGVVQSASSLPVDGSGTGGVTITSIDGVPIATFSAFSNKLEANSTSFQLVSNFTLGSDSDGINPLTEPTVLDVGSYSVTIPAQSFNMNREGYYVYEGRINGETLQVQIVPSTATVYTLKAEGAGTPITLGNQPWVVLRIGNDIGAGAATLSD